MQTGCCSQSVVGVPAKMPTVEAFCSSQGSLEGIWLERAKKLVAEVPGEEFHTGLSHVFPQRSARQSWQSSGRESTCSARNWRVSLKANCSKRNLSLSGFFSSFSPRSLESQIFAREQLGCGHWCWPDSGLASDDPRLLSLHECWPSVCAGARLEARSDLQSGDAGR